MNMPEAAWQRAAVLVAYGCAFLVLHRLAAFWNTASSFSLWFPSAGLRFAMLWHFGARKGPALAFVEIAMQAITGVVSGALWWTVVIGIAGSSLAYAAAVHAVRSRFSSGRTKITMPPMPLGLAMILCPVAAAGFSLPWGLLSQLRLSGGVDFRDAVEAVGIFWIGDLLGILVIAPPLLWALARDSRHQVWQRPHRTVEAVAVVFAAALISLLVWLSTTVVHVEPLLLSSVWVALRLGRMPAWLAGAFAALVILLTANLAMPLEQRASMHLLAASIIIAGYLVGSYADAETYLRSELMRQQRLLLHAERLKSLRAMSLAIIHDISQPLSTLSIETKYLRQLAGGEGLDRSDLINTSLLVERKTSHLAEMVRRMRLFGEDLPQNDERVSIPQLLQDVADLVRPEALASSVELIVEPCPPFQVSGRAIELQQALLNLVRNALGASPRGVIMMSAEAFGAEVHLKVTNARGGLAAPAGMGIGLIIARTIAEAHGGKLIQDAFEEKAACYSLALPRLGGMVDDE